jgi:predicted PurR-regulated permease PerM
MRTQRTAVGTTVITLSVVVIILAASFAFYYASAASQVSTLNARVSSLKESGQTLCQSLSTELPPLLTLMSNTTIALQDQIQNDNSMVAALNSTMPSGYASMIDTLNSQMTENQYIINQTISINGPAITSGGGPCAPFYQP